MESPETSRETISTSTDNSDPIPALLSPRSRSTFPFNDNGYDPEIPTHFSGAVPKQRNSVDALETDDVEYLQQKLVHLKLRLDESAKTIQAEREWVLLFFPRRLVK